MKLETLAVHAGYQVDSSTGAIIAPVNLSMTFERAADGSYPGGFVYSRLNNPKREALERCAAAIEGGAAAAAFSSGSAAAMSVFQALSPTDHVIAQGRVLWHGGRAARRVRALGTGNHVRRYDRAC